PAKLVACCSTVGGVSEDDDDDDDGGTFVDVAPTSIAPVTTPPPPEFELSQVTELPATGETPWWRDWVIYGGGLLIVLSGAGTVVAYVQRRRKME
ncbi:MAG: hypothetical protein AAF653_19590, partial [Chloroflexota bacterium]